jgi:hypothetical protein
MKLLWSIIERHSPAISISSNSRHNATLNPIQVSSGLYREICGKYSWSTRAGFVLMVPTKFLDLKKEENLLQAIQQFCKNNVLNYILTIASSYISLVSYPNRTSNTTIFSVRA